MAELSVPEKQPPTSAEVALATYVAVSPPSHWGPTCPAWLESAERQCGKAPTEGILCSRHRKVAERRLEAARQRSEDEMEMRLAWRAIRMDSWRAELAKVDAEINRLDPPPVTTDRAAYTGAVHPSINRGRRVSDSKMQRMASLWERRNRVAALIGDDQ